MADKLHSPPPHKKKQNKKQTKSSNDSKLRLIMLRTELSLAAKCSKEKNQESSMSCLLKKFKKRFLRNVFYTVKCLT